MARNVLNLGLPGNSIAEYIAREGTLPVEQGHYMSRMALAFEVRTQNLIAWHAYVSAQGDLPDESAALAKQIEARLPVG